MEQLQNQIQQSLYTILGLLISLATIYVVIYLNRLIKLAKEKANAIQNEEQKKIVNDTLDRLNKVLLTNIVRAENTVKKDILVQISDGKITKDELNKLAEDVKNDVINQMGQDAITLLSQTYGDINGYIESLLEKQLADLKISGEIPTVDYKLAEIEEAKKQIEKVKKQLDK